MPISITDSNGIDVSGNVTHIANINPYRYRGYRYDVETGLYYLQSRYYDPILGRFLNADTIMASGDELLGHNLYIYCHNNPVNKYDPNGYFAKYVQKIYELAKGWLARIDKASPPSQKHIHVYKPGDPKSYSQNMDGSPHDKNKNTPGDPPDFLKKELERKVNWNWDANKKFQELPSDAKIYYGNYGKAQMDMLQDRIRPSEDFKVPTILPAPIFDLSPAWQLIFAF